MNRKKEKDAVRAPSLGERICRALDLPSDLIDGEKIEWHGGGLRIWGCRRILLYSSGEVRLRLSRRVLVVRGAGLTCSSFSLGEGTVGVDGQIVSLGFEGGIA